MAASVRDAPYHGCVIAIAEQVKIQFFIWKFKFPAGKLLSGW